MRKIIHFPAMLLLCLSFLVATGGCTSAAEQAARPESITATGAIVVAEDASGAVLRAYGPNVTVFFRAENRNQSYKARITLTNMQAGSVTIHGMTAQPAKILSPTSVQYELTVPAGTSEVNFTTVVSPSFSFAVMGDNRDGRSIYISLLDKISERNPAFVINGGDLVPSGRADQYGQFLNDSASLHVPYFTALGNHDIVNGGRQTYNANLAPNYYDFTWSNAQFIVLDNADGTMDDRQLSWLEDKLAHRTAQHVFLVMHKPPFDPRPGGSHTVNSKQLAERLMQLAAQYRVTAVFASHIHMFYQGNRLGVPYYITGGAGAPLYARPEDGGIYHYLLVEVHGSEIRITPVQL